MFSIRSHIFHDLCLSATFFRNSDPLLSDLALCQILRATICPSTPLTASDEKCICHTSLKLPDDAQNLLAAMVVDCQTVGAYSWCGMFSTIFRWLILALL